MSRQKRPVYLSLMSTIILSLLIGVFLFARKRVKKSKSSSTITKHSVETSPEDTIKYWTADKMRDAKPAPMPEVNEKNLKKSSSSRPQ